MHIRTTYLSALLLPFVTACVGTPHNHPSEVSALEIAIYKAGIKMGCIDAGKHKGDDSTQNLQFCSCVQETLEREMSVQEWQAATYFSQQRKSSLEQQVIAPYMADIQSCRNLKPTNP